jgi:acetyl/propionyl-CoA carboxylase alpha subunit
VVAAGGALPDAASIERRGWAIEARIYAEDPARDFLPQAGRAERVRWARGPFVRIDAGIESGDGVPVHYDPILAKVIAFGPDRASALARLTGALDETRVHGVVTNLPFLRALARARAVLDGAFDTEWIEREFLAEFAAAVSAPAPDLALAAAALAETLLPGGGRPAAGVGSGAAPSRATPDPFASQGAWRLPGLD